MKRHLVIMAAGTGGHIMPGLAVAQEMQQRGWSVSWLGTEHGMENRLVPPTGMALDQLNFSGMRGKGWRHMVSGSVKLVRSILTARRILQRVQAHAVLGMGGYVCIPGGLAAAWRRVPLVLMNADAAPLMSNRALLPFAERVCFGFDGRAVQTTRHAVVTGNPVRPEIAALSAPSERFKSRAQGPVRILVVGGSLGAQVLNETLPRALALMPAASRPHVTHQTGTAHIEHVQALYQQLGLESERIELLPFIDNMAARLADCDLIICRAGAITISELCAAGVASFLVPLIVSTTSHQRDNALYMAAHDAAVHIPQTAFTPQTLAQRLQTLNRTDLQAMAERAHALARTQAASAVANQIEQLTSNPRPSRKAAL